MASTIGKRVRTLRFAKGMGADELAKASGVSRTSLYQLESGRANCPRAATIKRMADCLGVSADYLLNGPEVQDSEPTPKLGAAKKEALRKFGELLDSAFAGLAISVVSDLHESLTLT